MKIRIDYLKLASSHDFGAFANKTFKSVEAAKAWIVNNVPERELDLIKVWIDRRLLSGRELRNVTGE